MVHNIFDEGDIGFHAANAEFAEGAVHTLTSFGKICAPGGDFDEKRIVIGGEHRAGISGAAVEPNTETRGRTIGGDFPVVGGEVFLRVLGGHATLESRAVEGNIFLFRQRHRGLMQFVTLCGENLRTHEIDSRNHFGHGVLDLNARIDLDEIPLLRINVVEKFDGSGIAIVGLARQLQRRIAEFATNTRGEIRGGSDFDDLLMTALNGTVAFVKMQQVTVLIGEDLDFQVPRARQIFFQENGRIAEGGARLTLGFFQKRIELRGITNNAHAAAAAAHRRFHNDGITDLPRNLLGLRCRLDRILRSGQNRHSR